ncbi:MAG: hypothetical protein P9M06_05900 [Candidatus Saelkia tenebricola]|nr:hypothetical protein [Candidatus Saelkia tenebricola]
MRLFLNAGNWDGIKKKSNWGILDGAIMNSTVVSKELMFKCID